MNKHFFANPLVEKNYFQVWILSIGQCSYGTSIWGFFFLSLCLPLSLQDVVQNHLEGANFETKDKPKWKMERCLRTDALEWSVLLAM